MKKLIFGFSDPGGANQIAAILHCLNNERDKKKVYFRILTDERGFKHKDLLPYLEVVDPELDKMEKIIIDFQPDQIFTAASLSSYIEHNLIKLSNKYDINSITFLDHWTDYYAKFYRDGDAHFPNLILLNDERAKDIAIEQGLPRKRLRVVGNLFYENLLSYCPTISEKEFFDFFDIDYNKKIILFISDSITEQNGGYNASLKKFGFNEISIFTALLNIFNELIYSKKINSENFSLLIKLHPKEDISKYDHFFDDSLLTNYTVVQNCDIPNHDILYYSNFHVGMFSSMIIESIILGKKVLRVEINNSIGDLINIDNKYFKYIIKESDLRDGLLWLLNHDNLLLYPQFNSTVMKYF